MVASSSPSAPLAFLVGITGTQGSSVANALLASPKPYRIVGITRDASKPSAQQWRDKGCDIVELSIRVGNENEVKNAIKGAEIFFAVTNFDEHGDKDRETAEGKLMVDACLATQSTLKLFVWSSLVGISKLSEGEFPDCAFFDAKDDVTEYLKASGLPFANVPCGFYASNIPLKSYGPEKQPDGSYELYLPCPPSTQVPVLDTLADYGGYVQAAIENPSLGPGSEILTGKLTSLQQIADELAEVSGKTIIVKQVDRKTYIDDFLGPKGMGKVAPMLWDMFAFFGVQGYYGLKDVEATQRKAGIVPRSFRQILEANASLRIQ